MNTEIAQNGEEIQARVSKQEFNASRKRYLKLLQKYQQQLRE